MTYKPGNQQHTRNLLAALAVDPDPSLNASWATELAQLTGSIRVTVTTRSAGETVPYPVLHRWRNDLDRLLGAFAREDPERWISARTPGTWLDSTLRLRSALTHVVSKAYWSAHTDVRYADIEIERYLWGAR